MNTISFYPRTNFSIYRQLPREYKGTFCDQAAHTVTDNDDRSLYCSVSVDIHGLQECVRGLTPVSRMLGLINVELKSDLRSH